MNDPRPRAIVVGYSGPVAQQRRALSVGDEVTFGRGNTVTFCFPSEPRLSRLAGVIRGLDDGVVVTNLSTTHDLNVRLKNDNVRLAASVAGHPVAALLLTAGDLRITWPGAMAGYVEISINATSEPETKYNATVIGRTTERPMSLNRNTKEFAVALLLCRPRLRADLGARVAPTVPDLTRQILEVTSSVYLLRQLDRDRETRRKMLARTHEHLKNLRDKVVQAGLVNVGVRLSVDRVADLLVTHNILTQQDLALLEDPKWINDQQRRWNW